MSTPVTARTGRRRGPGRTLAALAAAALLLTACGDDGGGDTVSSGTTPTPSPSAASMDCPLVATEVSPPAGVSDDLSVKPEVSGNPAPAPTELQYADVVEGDGEQAVTGSAVELKYVGSFYETGEEFDSSWSRGPEETIPVGICRRGVIPGFAVGPTGMKVGGRRVITIPAELGYGSAGNPPVIGPDLPLVFIVDLVSVEQP
jgi:hypothetical protein